MIKCFDLIQVAGRQTSRQTNRQIDRQTDRQTGRQAGRQADRQAGREQRTVYREPHAILGHKYRHNYVK